MNSLDSRFLRFADTFAQSFAQPGRYSYDLGLPLPNRIRSADAPFTINVRAARSNNPEGRQHNVSVRSDGGRLKADPPTLEIEAGDAVLWSAATPSTPGFCISGHSETDSFSSAAIAREALYTHAFGSPGVFEWEDANGHRVSGKVVVTMPPTGSAREMGSYKDRLSQATLVVISGERVEPPQVEVVVGQTVFFAVERAEGITITDRRLKAEIPLPQLHT
jgi:plastocyanin